MASALKWITTRAKQIYKKGGTWAGAIKKAGAEYRGKKKKPATKKRRRVSGTLSSGARPSSNSIGRVKKRKTARRRKVGATLSTGPRPSSNAIGRVSAASLISHAKKKIGEQISKLELRKFTTKGVAKKKKVAKVITMMKSKYRKLC